MEGYEQNWVIVSKMISSYDRKESKILLLDDSVIELALELLKSSTELGETVKKNCE